MNNMHSASDYVLRGVVVASASAMSFVGSINVLAQSLPGAEDMKWMPYIEKGGGWVVLLVVLWVYRRDYKRLSEGETARVDQLIALHEKSAKANQDVAVALSRNTEVLRSVVAFNHGQHYDPEERRRDDINGA